MSLHIQCVFGTLHVPGWTHVVFKAALNLHHIDSTDTGTGYKITQWLQICQQHMQIFWSTTPKGVLFD